MIAEAVKIKLKYLIIERIEGPGALCGIPVLCLSWDDANAALADIAKTAPDDGTYDKTVFTILWRDGEIYQGRYDVKRHDIYMADLQRHIRKFAECYSGRVRPRALVSRLLGERV